MAKDKEKKKFETGNNAACSTLNLYCKSRGNGSCVLIYEQERYIYARINYGKAKIEAYYLYVDKGAMTDVVFDLSNVFKVYGKQYGSMRNFFDEIFKRTSMPFFYVAEWNNRANNNVEALGCPIAGMPADPFHKYCVWAPSLSELMKALDRLLGKSFHDMDSEKVTTAIINTGLHNCIPYLILLAAVTTLGLVLLILGIVGTINKVVGWLFGLILLIVGGFFLGVFISVYKGVPADYLKYRLDDRFFTADQSQFTRM